MHRNEKSIRIGKTVIPAHAIHWQFSRSQGPGVSTSTKRIHARNFIDIQHSNFLSPAVASDPFRSRQPCNMAKRVNPHKPEVQRTKSQC